MNKPDGGPAFPQMDIGYSAGGDAFVDRASGGMSVRDWFAGQALIALTYLDARIDGANVSLEAPEAARHAYAFADAMIVERSKP